MKRQNADYKKKNKKPAKKVLTKGGRGGILTKLSDRTPDAAAKKVLKKMKKTVDK